MRSFLATAYVNIMFAVLTPLFLFTGIPKAAFVYSIIYFILTAIGAVPLTAMALRPSKVGMSMAVLLDENGHKVIDSSVWDHYMERYENRRKNRSRILQISDIASFATIIMFMLARVYPVVCLIIFTMVIGKIAVWRLYKTIKSKRTRWGAAAFVLEAQELLGRKEE